jgi:type IV secretion system protein VirB9
MKPPSFRKAGIPAPFKPAMTPFRNAALPALLLSGFALAGCASKFTPPDISYDAATPAKLTVDPPAPVTVVELPKPLPLPGQLKPLSGRKAAPEAADPTTR